MEGLRTNGTGISSLAPDDAARVRVYLATLLASPEFVSSGRKTQLLRYLVETTLDGEQAKLSEYGIGLDVFERPASFDPRTDSLVRAEVSRLRVKLRDYYGRAGRNDAIAIELPHRSYVPRFNFRSDGIAEQPAVAAGATVRASWMPWLAGACVLAVLASGVAYWRSRTATSSPLKSVVVLPFENYSQGPQYEYLAEGITEELTNQLAQWRELRVVARTSAYVFKGKAADVRQIGRLLNVDAVLEGSCIKQGDRIKITAQLSRAADGYHLWSHSFEARSEDMLSVQDDMAQAIAAAVHAVGREKPKLIVARSTTNATAHDLYLRANFELAKHTPQAVKNGLDLLRSAVRLDPSYVTAYIQIERAEIALVHYTAESPKEGLQRARTALDTALQLDPHSADAHGELADLAYVYDWDWPRAESEFQVALANGGQATTHSYYGWGLATRGRFEEAQRQFRIAEDLDPLGMGPRFNQAIAFNLERKYSEAARVLRAMLEVHPDQIDAHLILGSIAVSQHDCRTAEREFGWSAQHFQAPVTKFGLALASGCRGEWSAAERNLRDMENGATGFVSPYQLALGRAYLNEREAALSYLEKSADAKEGQILYLKYEPFFDALRSDRRYIALEKRVGLKP